MRWQIRASMDAGGLDPSTERDVVVIGGADRLTAGEVSVAASVMDQGGQAQIYVEPVPLLAGQPFRGYVETPETLDVGRIRVELKQQIATTGAGGGGLVGEILGNTTLNMGGNTTISVGGSRNTSEDRVLWTGPLAPMGVGPTGNRYQFAGPAAACGHGNREPAARVVERDDRHRDRPAAAARSPHHATRGDRHRLAVEASRSGIAPTSAAVSG